MAGREKYAGINELLNKRIAEKKLLIAVHRGSSTGNIVQNTIPAYMAALRMGADMLECDLVQSTDGVLYVFHDGNEHYLYGGEKNIKQCSSREIEAAEYKNSIHHPSGFRVERFESVLRHFQKGELFNVDRAWDILPAVHEMLEKYPEARKQAVIKTPVKKEYLDFFEECPVKYMYMPIANNMEEIREVLSYENINVVGAELIAKTPEAELLLDDNIRWIRDQGLFCWSNAITLGGGKEYALSGGFDDDKAIIEGPEQSWGILIEKGYNVLQTDWPGILDRFRSQYFGEGKAGL